MGYPAIYPLPEARFEGPAEAVLMDLDGTSVHSEEFWIWIIEQTTARLLGNPKFPLEEADEPHVSGHSVSASTCSTASRSTARTRRSRRRARTTSTSRTTRWRRSWPAAAAPTPSRPRPGLKEFLLRAEGPRHQDRPGHLGPATRRPGRRSCRPSARWTWATRWSSTTRSSRAGHAIRKGQAGTLGELAPKPHPWLYAETARVGLGIDADRPRTA